MGTTKLSIKHTVGKWDNRNYYPIVTDWGDADIARMNVVHGDNVLVNLWAREELTAGTVTNIDLSGGSSYRCIIRASQSADAACYGFQTQYNQGQYPAGEVLASGKITWLVTIGNINFSIVAVNVALKTFGISGDWTANIKDNNTLTISASTGNDGTYTVNGNSTYSAANDRTSFITDEAIPDATVDGIITHSAVQNATFDSHGDLDVFAECSWINAAGDPQTVLPSFPCRIHEQLEDGGAASAAGTSLTYVTTTVVGAVWKGDCWPKTIMDPANTYSVTSTMLLIDKTIAEINVDRVITGLNTAAQQVLGDLKYADDFITKANPIVIKAFDTTSGRMDSTSITNATIPTGKCVYLDFDAQPNAAITQMAIAVHWHYNFVTTTTTTTTTTT